jgi:CHASE3 domain sensor protein
MPDTNQRLRGLWINVQHGWAELQEALKAHRSRPDEASIERVQKAMKAHSDAISAYTKLFNSRVHPGRQLAESKNPKRS